MDSSPGGYRKFVDFAQSSGGLTQERNFYSVRDRACFIPVTSGLGYSQQPADNCTPAGQNLVCNGTIPFDAYYGPTGHNEEHIQLTPGNVEFIRNEILLKTPTPVFIVAPTEICSTSNATFSVKAECVASRVGQPQSGTTYSWTAGPGLQLLSRQGAATMQVAGTSNTPTDTYLEVVATRQGYASSAPVRVNVHIGPTVLGPLTNLNGDCAGSVVTIAVVNQNVDQDFKWSFGPGLVYDSRYDGQSSIQYQLPTSGPRSWPVRVTAHDKCNRPALIILNQDILVTYDAGCENTLVGSASGLQVYPNPADASFDVLPPSAAKPGMQTATLYNAQGKEMRQLRSKGKIRFMTADLPDGIYYLVLEQPGHQLSNCHVRIQH